MIEIIVCLGSVLGIVLSIIKLYEWLTAQKKKEELIKIVSEAVREGRFYLRWICEVDIQDFECNVIETNDVIFVNLQNKSVIKTWHHIWGEEEFFKTLTIEAYDEKGNRLGVEILTEEPTHKRFAIKFARPVMPLKPYRYRWIQKYKQFKNLEKGEWFEFQHESLIKDLIVRIIFPPNSTPSAPIYCYTFENGEKVPLRALNIKKKKGRYYAELKISELRAFRILRFEFSVTKSLL